jgi:predicted transposase YbfD/YdcC
VHLAAAADTGRFAGTGVVAALAKVPDPRARRGVRHQIGAILVLAACAVLAGCRSFTAIGEWVANAYDQILAALEVGGCRPCESTIRRTLQRLDGDELDTAIGGWAAVGTQPPAGRRVVALDGKTVRGSASDTAEARHLLAAIDHRTAVVLGQVDVARKTNEIPMFPVLCDRLDDLTDAVITADALHAQRGHADYLVLQRRAHYLLTVKTGIVFPHARQAIQITHKTRRLKSNKWTTEVVYAVTSLTTEQATATELATWIRGHWAIENRLHRVRDVTYDEDRSQVRTHTGPRAMASLHNLALSILRIHDVTNIAQALRHHAWDPLRPTELLLTS